VLERVGSSVVLITKELTLSAAVIEALPASVKLICEAGTGKQNDEVSYHMLNCCTAVPNVSLS
jgi:glycerate dehydrogenase